jgi:galactose mutarotase-like enzyme
VRSPYPPPLPVAEVGHPPFGRVSPGLHARPSGPLTHAEALVCFNSLAMPAHSPRISVASPTGQQWRIGHGRQEVIVCEVGATLRAYTVGQTAVLDGFGADEWSQSGRGQVLAPWPNRLADGRYEFNGVRAQAALDEPERRNAIHGLVRWMPWTLQTRHQNQLSLRLQLHPSPGYPFSLLLEIEYHVGRDGLTVTTRAQSLEEGLIPFGIGFHPYLTAGPETVDGAILHVPARHTLDVDDRGLPTGALAPVEGTDRDFTTARFVGPAVLDTAYTTLERDSADIAWASLDPPGGVGGAALWLDAAFPYLMVYTGDTLGEVQRRRRAVALEPMTCPPNALRTGTDVVALEPGQEWTARWGINPR